MSRLNRAAAYTAIPVEKGLFELLQLADRITRESGGAFDVSAGALIKAWGFYRGPRRVPSVAERAAALDRVGMRHVLLAPEQRLVRYRRQGLEINLGSIGKGYALDRAAAVLRQRQNLPGALLHGGHSSVYAIGTEPGEERGWAVGVSHPWEPGRRIALLRLRDWALGTSAATFRHLEHEGRKLGHVLDPRTGWPAEGMALATPRPRVRPRPTPWPRCSTSRAWTGPAPTAMHGRRSGPCCCRREIRCRSSWVLPAN